MKRTDAFLNKIKPIADDKKLIISQLVMLWTLEQPGITITLVGSRNSEQAAQNAKAVDASLTQDEFALITRELNHLKLVR